MSQTTYTMRDLARLIESREGILAPGSETGLLGAFVSEYDHTQTIIDTDAGDKPISDDEYTAWERAYILMERYDNDGIDYELGDLF